MTNPWSDGKVTAGPLRHFSLVFACVNYEGDVLWDGDPSLSVWKKVLNEEINKKTWGASQYANDISCGRRAVRSRAHRAVGRSRVSSMGAGSSNCTYNPIMHPPPPGRPADNLLSGQGRTLWGSVYKGQLCVRWLAPYRKKNMHLRFNFICQAEDWKDEASGKAEICLHFFPGATNDLWISHPDAMDSLDSVLCPKNRWLVLFEVVVLAHNPPPPPLPSPTPLTSHDVGVRPCGVRSSVSISGSFILKL